tara:strand:- start:677 stop:1327 length:651 start_codon:yes stop_codon:yes gene_type:complete
MPILHPERNPLMLDPIPELEFFKDEHRYRWRGEWLAHSVSDVLDVELTPFKRAMIEKYKHGPDGWAIRGETIHEYLDGYLKGGRPPVPEKWDKWIDALLDEDFFGEAEVIATEYRVVDPLKNCAGSFDFLVRKNGLIQIGDLKTVSSKKAVAARKPATAQLGAYSSFLARQGVYPDVAVTIVVGPEKVKVVEQSVGTCLEAWEEAWGKFQATQPQF